MGSDIYMEERRMAPERLGEAVDELSRISRDRTVPKKVRDRIRALLRKWNEQ